MAADITGANKYKKSKMAYDGATYAKYNGADPFFEHIVVNPDKEDIIKTAPVSALMFMIRTHIKPTDNVLMSCAEGSVRTRRKISITLEMINSRIF